MRVLVAIPWRFAPTREDAFAYTYRWWQLAVWDVLPIDSDPSKPFSLAAARNDAVRYAERHGFDVVVHADADTFGEYSSIMAATYLAYRTDEWVIPYTEYRGLGPHGTVALWSGVPAVDCPYVPVDVAISGIYVTTPACWWSVGGQDEHYVGWAPEDYSMLMAYRTLRGKEPLRVEGRAYAQHHESAVKEGPTYDAAIERYQRYVAAAEAGDVAAMRELVGERHG